MRTPDDMWVKGPQTQYATTRDGVHIAYQVSGSGSIDLLWPEGCLSHVEILWEYPPYARGMQMLGRSFRVIYRRDYAGTSVEETEYLRALIAAARMDAVGGVDEQPYFGEPSHVVGPVARVVDALRSEEEQFDRALATVLFTDIIGSTEAASRLGDRGWREVVERHHATVRSLLARYRGSDVDTAGADGEGSRRRLRALVPGCRRARAEGCSRPVASLPSGDGARVATRRSDCLRSISEGSGDRDSSAGRLSTSSAGPCRAPG
jgi:hypothetical protein